MPGLAKARLHEKEMQHLYREGLHAAMHAMLNVIPLHVMCGPGDMGAECDNPYSARFRPDRLLLFDKCPGGIGLSYKVRPLAEPCCIVFSRVENMNAYSHITQMYHVCRKEDCFLHVSLGWTRQAYALRHKTLRPLTLSDPF